MTPCVSVSLDVAALCEVRGGAFIRVWAALADYAGFTRACCARASGRFAPPRPRVQRLREQPADWAGAAFVRVAELSQRDVRTHASRCPCRTARLRNALGTDRMCVEVFALGATARGACYRAHARVPSLPVCVCAWDFAPRASRLVGWLVGTYRDLVAVSRAGTWRITS